MRKILFLTFLLVLTGLIATNAVAKEAISKEDKYNQQRIKDAINMSKMIEYFYKKTGKYPLAPENPLNEVTVIITKNKEFIPKRSIPWEKMQKELFEKLGKRAVLAMDPEDKKKEAGRVYKYRTNGQDYWFAVFLTKENGYTKTEGLNLYKIELTSRPRADRFQYSIKNLQRFLKFGKDNKRMQNTLFKALSNDSYDWALELIMQGANLNPACKTTKDCQPLVMAVKEGNLDKIKFLLKYGADINGFNSHGNTPLMKALEFGKIDAAKLLIEKGANIHIPNIKGLTPFLVAILIKNYELVNLLLEKGADVNKNYILIDELSDDVKLGVRPLEAAVQAQDTKLVKLLLEKGANPNNKTAKGADLLKYAKSLQNKEIVKLLEDVIKKSLK